MILAGTIGNCIDVIRLNDYAKATQHDWPFRLLFFAGVFSKTNLNDGEDAD